MNAQERAWYDKKRFLIPLLIFLYPIGMYALYKNREWGQNTKIAAAVASSVLLVVLGTSDRNEDNGAETAQGEPEEQVAGIWGKPDYLCDVMKNVGLDTSGSNGYTGGASGLYMCQARKTLTERTEASDYMENDMEYLVMGHSPNRVDSVKLELQTHALNQAEQDRLRLMSHASALVETAFERDFPEEVEHMVRENESGTWSDEDLRITISQRPFHYQAEVDGGIYKLLIQPTSDQ